MAKGKPCTDHLGNSYEALKDMCEYWKIKPNAYKARRARGLSIEESLTTPLRCDCVDHLGNKFKSMIEMCKYWGVSMETYNKRKKKELPLEQCLSTELLPNENKQIIIDHLGNEFKTVKEMCKHWKISTSAYYDRKLKGLSLEQCLSTKHISCSANIVIDHLGNEFKSITEMCKYWNVSYSAYSGRIESNYTQEEALTKDRIITGGFRESTVVSLEERTDHLGNVFKSMAEMCKYWNIKTNTYRERLNRGYTKKESLTLTDEEIALRNRSPYSLEERTDHLGNVFTSINNMCKYWNISVITYKKRKKLGLSKKDCLILPKIYDHLNNEFDSVPKMCKYWNIPLSTYRKRINDGMNIKEALTSKTLSIQDFFGKKFKNTKEMCKYWNINKRTYSARIKKYPISIALGIIPMITMFGNNSQKNFWFRDFFYIGIFLYKGIDNNEYWSCIINNQEMILSKDEIYKRMEAIVIEEHNNGTFKFPNQTTEKSGN